MQIAINAKNFQIQNPLWMLALQLLLVRMPNVSNDIKKKKDVMVNAIRYTAMYPMSFSH